MWDEEAGDYKNNFEFYGRVSIIDYVNPPTWLEVANTILNPIERNALKEDVTKGGELIAGTVNYNENVGRCPNTKYIISGFGIGAAKARESLKYINPDKVLYAAFFSDPTLYLPEGKGLFPDACVGKNLSDYRMYVPNCRTHDGVLGGADPYVPAGYEGKVGTWCNKNDMYCGSGISMEGNSRYDEDGIYEDAAKVVYDKIRQEYNFDYVYSPHDTAILIDSTGSMESLITNYKEEALNLAKRTLESGGRVALYDYRDFGESYYPVQHCNFETCTLQSFQDGLDSITASDGGDIPESLLWSSKLAMKELTWRKGATKSLVVLTDAGYHSPDLDGTTFADIVKLSKEIDPVNFYVVTTSGIMNEYYDLVAATDGAVVSSTSDLSLLTARIMERYDSLPRVEEDDGDYEGDISDKELIRSLLAERTKAEDIGSLSPEDSAKSSTDALKAEYPVVVPKAPNTGKGKIL